MLEVLFTGDVCNRCKRDLTKSVKLYGKEALNVHTRSHLSSDIEEYIEVAYIFAKTLKEDGIIVEAHDRLKKLDPEMYERKIGK